MSIVEQSTAAGPGVAEPAGGTVVYESQRTRVRRLPPLDGSGAGAIWKEMLGPGAAERAGQEIAVLTRLAGVAGVPRLLATPRGQTGFAVTDQGGKSLAAALSGVPVAARGSRSGPDVAELVTLGCKLARLLVGVHRAGVVHKDINPANIVRGEDQEPVLIDWEMATTFAQERPGFTHESVIVGTLAYMAPEQTGRTGRGVDHRADLYALGATLYELATGAPPFGHGGEDLLGLIHAHLAKVPVPVDRVNPLVPTVLSAVIGRLLEKEPDRRYQSAQGLAFDLARLQKALTGDGADTDGFVLGERDFPVRIAAPSRLVGRDAEIGALREAFTTAVAGGARGILVTGAPGTGKSVLIDELRAIVTAAGGWYVQGKFDQYRQDRATDGVGLAMQGVLRMLLAEPEEQLRKLRGRLLASMGPAAGVLAAMGQELGQEFSILLDVAPANLAAMDPAMIARHLHQGCLGLLRVVATDRPLVLVIDDLQWASAFPISFLDALLLADDLPGLLLVGAYRDGEVGIGHPLSVMLTRWKRLGAIPPELHLENLPPSSLSVLLETMLRLSPDSAPGLAEAIGTRTGGNPYDTVELVDALRREGVLTAGDTGWEWDRATIRGFVGEGDVVELLAARIRALPTESGSILADLACLGGEVTVGFLADATGLSPAAVTAALAPALEDGLLVRIDEGAPAVRFRHDRVQQAAYAQRAPAARRDLHQRLGRRLAARFSLTRNSELEGPAAEQYLAALPDGVGPAEIDAVERLRVVGLFRMAAAHQRLANGAQAERFLAAALRLLTPPADAFEEPSVAALLTGLLIERHAVLFDLFRLDETDPIFAQITRRVPGPAELAPIVAVQILSLTHRARGPEAVDLALTLLIQLGFAPPTPETMPAELADGLDRLDRWVAAGPQAGELDRPELTDPRSLAATLVLNRAFLAAYMSHHPLTAWLAFQAHRLWVEEGPHPRLGICLGVFPALGIALRQDYLTGYTAAKRILHVCEVRGYDQAGWLIRCALLSFGLPWFEPIEKSIEQASVVREGLLRHGEWLFASFTYLHALWVALDTAPVLDTSVTMFTAASKHWALVGDDYTQGLFCGHPTLLRTLRGDTDPGDPFGEAALAAAVRPAEETGDPFAAFFVNTTMALAAALFGRPEQLGRHTSEAMRRLPVAVGMYTSATAHLLRGLALAAALPATDSPEREAVLAEFDSCRSWLADRAADAPANYGHLVTWLDAERAWALGDFRGAAGAFDAALTEVPARRFPWQAALITERAGRCQLTNGLIRGGSRLLAQARERYAAWGAVGKVIALHQEFPELPAPEIAAVPHVEDLAGRGQSMIRSAEVVDLLAVLHACQALSSETNLDRLRVRLVEILTAMTGATAVTLGLWNDDAQDWFVPSPDQNDGTALSVEEAGRTGLICLTAFRYAERTRQPLLVPDATTDDRFTRDPYLADLDHCSLLVLPLYSRGTPRAILHLENRLSRGVFTTDRLAAVELLLGQLTVSLDNALAERFRSLVQRSSDLTLVANREGLITYASAASTEVLGIANTRLTGRPASDLLHPEDQPAFLAFLADQVLTGQMLQCRVLNATAASVWVEIRATDLTADPAVAGTVLHLRDVTERQRLENDLRHAQKMESVGQLAAGVAHEINTPAQFVADNLRFLADSFGALQTLLDAYRGAEAGPRRPELAAVEEEIDLDFLREEIPLAVQQALEGTTRVTTIVTAMKAFAHPGGEANTLTDLNEAIQNTLIVANSQIAPVAQIVLDLAELPPVWANFGDLNQAVLNLVINAAQAMGEAMPTRGPGTLTVRTRAETDAVLVQIQDTGNGIPPEIADRVFEQFFTTKPVGVGTGQGLALVHTLIHDRHGGTVGFESTPGVGTTFTIRLPHRDGPAG